MITDKNLRYAALEGLIRQGKIEPLDVAAYYKEKTGEEYDEYADYGYEPLPLIESYWQEQWDKLDVSQVEQITWDEAPEIQLSICPNFGGEDEYFDIKSLEGIGELSNLKEIELQFFASIEDLSPLLSLEKLQEVHLNEAYVENDANTDILEQLAAKGVSVLISGEPLA